jgi:hypothetical protein
VHIVTAVFAPAIVTTWVFKKKRSKYFHESGLSGKKKTLLLNIIFLLETTLHLICSDLGPNGGRNSQICWF